MSFHRVAYWSQFVLIYSIHFHCFGDDTQLFISTEPNATHQLIKLQGCLKDINTLMTSNVLVLNIAYITEVIVLSDENLRNMASHQILPLDDIKSALQ